MFLAVDLVDDVNRVGNLADVGVATTQTIIDRLTAAHPRKSEVNCRGSHGNIEAASCCYFG